MSILFLINIYIIPVCSLKKDAFTENKHIFLLSN